MTETEARKIAIDHIKKFFPDTTPEYIGEDQWFYFYSIKHEVGYTNYGVLKENGRVLPCPQ